MPTTYIGRIRSTILPISFFGPSRLRHSLLPHSLLVNPPLAPTPQPRPSAPAAPFSLGSSSSSVFVTASAPPATPTGLPLSPSVPEPASTIARIRRFLETRSEASATSIYTTVTQKFHDVSENSYRAILREVFPVGDAHPAHARIDYYSDRRLIIITIPGLPHELLATFDNDMRESLVSQGFLWPSWDTQRLKSCGAGRITLVHGRTRRETQPDGGLKILNQKLPFLLVEVADSQEYDNVLEKASWMLKHSKEKIRFAILIKLVRATAKEKRNNKRATRDAEFSPRPITKKVRMDDDDFLLSESDDIDFAAFKLTHDSVVRSLDYGLDSDISELSNVTSRDLFDFSILTTPEIPHLTVELEPKTIEFFPAGDVSSQARDPTSNISNDPANPPPRRNFFPVDETSYHSSSPLPRIETLSTTVATGPPSVSASRRPDSASGAPSTPDNPRAAYSSAFATVLTSYPVTGTHHEVNTPLDCVEFWPRRPGPTDNFTFGWEDMPGVRYPKVMRGKRFTIAFDGLHDTLEAFMRTTDSSRVRENVENLMGEWIDEWDSVESEVSEEGD